MCARASVCVCVCVCVCVGMGLITTESQANCSDKNDSDHCKLRDVLLLSVVCHRPVFS